jgi:arylsulfatase A-like enzyme
MCAPSSSSFLPSVSRRAVLQVTAASGAALVFSSALDSPATAATTKKRVYVLVVDGCKPGEITPATTPRLAELRDSGRNYPAARSLPVMETIPNHVMMMTGARPDRTGVPANTVYDRVSGTTRTMDGATDLRFPTVIERLNQAGYRTGTVLSKTYLYGVFGDRATHRWEPAPIIPVSGHAPDQFTMDAAIEMVKTFDPHLVFVNLGDVDRFGHSDLTQWGGLDLRVARNLALTDTDHQVGRFVDLLTSTGRWKDSVVVVLADHSMDWSQPVDYIDLATVFAADPLLAGKVQVADNGGADLCYWTGPDSGRAAGVDRMRSLALATPGVLSAHSPASLRLGPEAGDLVVYCRAGRRFSAAPGPDANPIPGNHGHPATEPIPFFVGGGSPLVRRRTSSSLVAHTMDVAPTVGAVFGLGAPTGVYDAASRL